MTVELDAFSGRPNPGWQLTPEQEQEFRRLLGELPRKPTSTADHGILGYRGLKAFGGDAIQFTIGGGELVQQTRSGVVVYDDPGRKLEKWLLGTAEGRVDERLLRSIRQGL